MKIKTTLLTLCLALGFCSCSRATEYTPLTFTEEKSIKANIVTDSLVLMTARDIAVYKDYIFVIGYNPEGWLHIYDRHTGNHIRTTVKIGQGPGEMIRAETLEISPDGEMAIWDIQSNKRGFFRVDSLVAGHRSLVREDHLSFPDGFSVNIPCRIAQDKWLYVGCNAWQEQPTKRFKLCENETEIASYDLYPADSTSSDFWGVWRSCTTEPRIAISPDGTKMAHSLLFGCIFETFDLTDGIKPATTQHFYKPDMVRDFAVRSTDDTYLGFSHLTATNTEIYGSYRGVPFSENQNGPLSIAIFNWNGKPLKRLQTEYCILTISATTDSGNTQIYAVGVDSEKNWKLLRFDL